MTFELTVHYFFFVDTVFENSVLRSLEVIKLRQRDNENTLHSILAFLNSDSFAQPAGKLNEPTVKLSAAFSDLDNFMRFDSTELTDEAVRGALVSYALA